MKCTFPFTQTAVCDRRNLTLLRVLSSPKGLHRRSYIDRQTGKRELRRNRLKCPCNRFPSFILTYCFAKIKGVLKKFFKTGKDICRCKNNIITIPRYTALQSHIPHSHPLIRRVSACVLIRFCICTITLAPHQPSPKKINILVTSPVQLHYH